MVTDDAVFLAISFFSQGFENLPEINPHFFLDFQPIFSYNVFMKASKKDSPKITVTGISDSRGDVLEVWVNDRLLNPDEWECIWDEKGRAVIKLCDKPINLISSPMS